MGEVLKTKDVADELGITVFQVQRMLRAGMLAGVRTSDGKYATWLIPRQSPDAFLGIQAAPQCPPASAALRSEDV